MNFNPNCTSRGFVPGAVLVTTPKFLLLAVQQIVLGGANWVLLKMLKNSVRNSMPSRSLAANLVLLNREKSKLSTPCDRSRGSTRGSLPKMKSGGAVKQEVLNHLAAFMLFESPSFDAALPGTDVSQLNVRFGREPPPKSVVPFTCPFVKTRGNPRWNMVTPSTPHPPTILSAAPLTPERNFLPLPNGRSRT